MQPSQLEFVYREATDSPGLIEFVQKLRKSEEKYKTKKGDVYALFSRLPLWEKQTTKNGHVKFKHKITKICIGYSNHGDTELDPGAAVTIREAVQKHLNIFNNQIFGWKTQNWKSEPNYAQAERRLARWQNS